MFATSVVCSRGHQTYSTTDEKNNGYKAIIIHNIVWVIHPSDIVDLLQTHGEEKEGCSCPVGPFNPASAAHIGYVELQFSMHVCTELMVTSHNIVEQQ